MKIVYKNTHNIIYLNTKNYLKTQIKRLLNRSRGHKEKK